MIKNYPIVVDTHTKAKHNSIVVNTNDLKTVKLLITINTAKKPIDLTGKTVRIAIVKPDKKTVFQNCTITDAVSGKCEVILNTQAYAVRGLHVAEMMVYSGTDTVAVTGTFTYSVVGGILSGDTVESQNDWQAINQAIADAEGILIDLRENGTGVDAQARQDLTTVKADLAQKATQSFVTDSLNAKRDKTVKLELEDMSSTTLAAIEGGAGTSFNLLSIPQDESVTNQKIKQGAVSLKKTVIDIFPNNPLVWMHGIKTFNLGALQGFTFNPSNIYKYDSKPIEVVGGSELIVNYSSIYMVAFHILDVDKKGIRDTGWVANGSKITLESNAKYITIGIKRNDSVAFAIEDIKNAGVTVETVVPNYSNLIQYNEDLKYKLEKIFPQNIGSLDPSVWENGYISLSKPLEQGYADGVVINTYLRTKIEKVVELNDYNKIFIKVADNYEFRLYIYGSDNSYMSYIDYRKEYVNYINPLWKKLAIVIRRIDQKPLTPSDIRETKLFVGYEDGYGNIKPNDILTLLTNDQKSLNLHEERIMTLEKNLFGNGLKYIGHAGMNAFAPENTLEAYELSSLMGMWGAETDVHMTSDSEIVLMHDATVDRTTNGTGAVANLTLAQIKELVVEQSYYDYDVKVPTLEEFLITCKKINMIPVIEIKSSEPNIDLAAEKIIEKLIKKDMINKTMIISFDQTTIDKCRSVNDTVWLAKILPPNTAITDSEITYAEKMGNYAIFSYNNSSLLTVDMVEKCHSKGIPVIYGTADTATVIDKAEDLGVNAIVTNKFYPVDKKSVKYTVSVQTSDKGVTWIDLGWTSGVRNSVNFNTSDPAKLGITFNNVPWNWLTRLQPDISISQIEGAVSKITPFYNQTTKQIECTFFDPNGVKLNLGDLPTYTIFRLSVIF